MMKTFLLFALGMLLGSQAWSRDCSPLLDFDVRKLNEDTIVNLCEHYQGQVILIVNTASRCVYTDQYDSLETLYDRYREDGLVVLGFPSNDFGNQEPGNEYQIRNFCRLTYAVEFPMFAKARVAEHSADPLFKSLAAAAGTYPQWNFHKYLIGRDGELRANFPSALDPLDEEIVDAIRRNLRKF